MECLVVDALRRKGAGRNGAARFARKGAMQSSEVQVEHRQTHRHADPGKAKTYTKLKMIELRVLGTRGVK